jgi:hypothetical protein
MKSDSLMIQGLEENALEHTSLSAIDDWQTDMYNRIR